MSISHSVARIRLPVISSASSRYASGLLRNVVHDIPLIAHGTPAFSSCSGRSAGCVYVRPFGSTPPATIFPSISGVGNISGTSAYTPTLPAAERSSTNVRSLIDL